MVVDDYDYDFTLTFLYDSLCLFLSLLLFFFSLSLFIVLSLSRAPLFLSLLKSSCVNIFSFLFLSSFLFPLFSSSDSSGSLYSTSCGSICCLCALQTALGSVFVSSSSLSISIAITNMILLLSAMFVTVVVIIVTVPPLGGTIP